ncbi:MAG TPA: extracellular solute-binding protein, partial [Roseiflexaceae bacterium]|nr:extracellular solute-binding protein [Roseiflexaceae bacterium]
WHGWSGARRQALGRLADRFNRRHPAERVSLVSVPLAGFAAELRSAVGAGAGPHLALIPNTWVGDLAEQGALLPLDDLVPEADRAALIPAALGGAQAPDAEGRRRLFGLPVAFDTLALFYNTANLSAPPADTDTLIRSARGLGDPAATPPVWGLALNLSLDNTVGYLYAFGGRVFDEDGALILGSQGRDGAERWLAWLQRLSTDERILARPDSSIHVDRELQDGRALMTFGWAHQLEIYRSLWGPNMGVAPLPRLSETGQPPRAYVRSDVLALNARVSPSERGVALAFLRFMVSEEAQLELLRGDMQPASRTLAIDGDNPQLAAARAFRAQAEEGLPMPNGPTRTVVEQELKVMQRQVLMGLATPADAVIEADRRLRQRLAPP